MVIGFATHHRQERDNDVRRRDIRSYRVAHNRAILAIRPKAAIHEAIVNLRHGDNFLQLLKKIRQMSDKKSRVRPRCVDNKCRTKKKDTSAGHGTELNRRSPSHRG